MPRTHALEEQGTDERDADVTPERIGRWDGGAILDGPLGAVAVNHAFDGLILRRDEGHVAALRAGLEALLLAEAGAGELQAAVRLGELDIGLVGGEKIEEAGEDEADEDIERRAAWQAPR